jgi:hypothetical protein
VASTVQAVVRVPRRSAAPRTVFRWPATLLEDCCLWLGGGGAPDFDSAHFDRDTAGRWEAPSSLDAHQAVVQLIASRFEPPGNPCPSFRPVPLDHTAPAPCTSRGVHVAVTGVIGSAGGLHNT